MTTTRLELIYKMAMDKLKYKFNSLFEEFSLLEENNPIEHIKYRTKKMKSIEEKLKKKNKVVNEENLRQLNDVLGVRIVCSFLDDLDIIIKRIEMDPEIHILNCKDYIQKPKKNGYMSYHLNIEFPIFCQGRIEMVKAEIQVRTIAMDMWASLDHKIWYKKGIDLPDSVKKTISDTAIICKTIDDHLNMLSKNASFRNQKPMVNIPFFQEKAYEIERLKYQLALETLRLKLNSISESYNLSSSVNPIEHISSRVKTDSSIYFKLKKYTDRFSVETMNQYLNDVAGIRIVCSFKSDLAKIVSLLKMDNDIEVINERNYVAFPKPSGYRAYHLIVLVPISLNTGAYKMKVEVQVRTIAMDMWASLEHKLCYHKDVNEEVRRKLINLSSSMEIIDRNMEESIKKSRELLESKEIDSAIEKNNESYGKKRERKRGC